MTTYDPLKKPDAEEWLALDEGVRLDLVRDFHRRKKIRLPSINAHVVVHVIIENQLAEGLSAATAALARLEAEGLDRHEAVHAMGSVLLEHVQNLMNGSVVDPNGAYLSALEKLTADSWRRSG